MAVNYAKLSDTAARLIAANGRSVTFVKLDTTPADAAKPWRGAEDPRDAEDGDATEVATSAIFVDPADAAKLGFTMDNSDSTKRASQVAIASLGSEGEQDLTTFDEVVDGSERWRIVQSQKLRPGNSTVLYFAGLSR